MLFVFVGSPLFAQEESNFFDNVINLPSSFFSKVSQKSSQITERLTKDTERYLHRLARCEYKLRKKLSKIDSIGAEQLFSDSDAHYRQLIDEIKSKSGTVTGALRAEYLPGMDSLKTSLAFLERNKHLLSRAQHKVEGSLADVNQLQSKLQQGEQIKAFVLTRKRIIREALSKYTKLPKGITNAFADFKEQTYYYQQQLREYRDILQDPGKMLNKGLSLLRKMTAFQQFMKQSSELASLFRLPDDYASAQSLAGLQSRAQVQSLIQNQLSGAGPNATQYVQENLQAAQAQLNTLKEKINRLGDGGGDMEIPDFKPNNQRTKTFWRRLEYGTNIQSAKSSHIFPTTTDLALSVGYKINDKGTIGFGASYKVGWGKHVRNIRITSEGVGVRSFLDVKIKGTFYASGGYEYNYQPIDVGLLTPSTSQPQAWQQSGLVGISKVVSIKSKFFKKTRLQMLWDFLSYQQVPRTQPVKFRVGYNL